MESNQTNSVESKVPARNPIVPMGLGRFGDWFPALKCRAMVIASRWEAEFRKAKGISNDEFRMKESLKIRADQKSDRLFVGGLLTQVDFQLIRVPGFGRYRTPSVGIGRLGKFRMANFEFRMRERNYAEETAKVLRTGTHTRKEP